MPADLAFSLSYLLGDALGAEVEVERIDFDPASSRLCIEALVAGRRASGCVEVKACKGLSGAKAERCIAKTLEANEAILERLASSLGGGGGGGGEAR